jgi:hypothetical protein
MYKSVREIREREKKREGEKKRERKRAEREGERKKMREREREREREKKCFTGPQLIILLRQNHAIFESVNHLSIMTNFILCTTITISLSC